MKRFTYTQTFNVVTFADPYKVCRKCGGWITGVLDKEGPLTVVPCQHTDGYDDVCPSWGPIGGCRCAAHLGEVRHGEPKATARRDEEMTHFSPELLAGLRDGARSEIEFQLLDTIEELQNRVAQLTSDLAQTTAMLHDETERMLLYRGIVRAIMQALNDATKPAVPDDLPQLEHRPLAP